METEFENVAILDFFTIHSGGGDAYFMKTGEHEALCMHSEHYLYQRNKYEFFKLNTKIIKE